MTMLLTLCALSAQAQDAAPPAPEPATTTDSGRLSFDDRLVKGQVAAGSVYLFQRNPRALPALVPVRRSYRAEIVDPLLAGRPKPKTDAR